MKGFDKASMVRRNKLINNLPRYDLGTTPINRGYQSASNSIPSPFVSQLGQNLSQMVSGQRQANTAQIVNSGAQLATQAKGIVDVGKQLKDSAFGNAESLAAKGTAAGLNAVATIPSAMQLYDAINTKGSFDGLGGNDLDMLASKNTEYRNGVAYENIGGVDNNNIMKAARAREFGENMNLTTNAIGTGAGVGATIGSFFPGAGNLIGAGIGALVGGLGSLFGWNNNEVKEQRRRLQNWRIASSAANTQNEAVAGSTGLRNEFYATHADQGLSPHRGKKNALVGGGEVITKHDSNGNVIDAVMEPVTQYTPERADVIPVHLNNDNGVLGNKINPLTGNRFAVDARYNINNPDALTQLVAIQDMVTNKNRIKKYDQGRYMGLLSMLPGIMEMGVGAKQAHSYAKDHVVSYNPYTANNNAAIAADELARLHYNPYPMLNSLRESDRQAIYNMNTASLSRAQRLAMLSTYYNNGMKNKADILASGQQLENQYRAAHANLLAQLGEQDATRRQQGNAAYHESLARARAARRKGIETGWQTGLKGINTTIGNYLNNYQTDRIVGLWYQEPGNNSEDHQTNGDVLISPSRKMKRRINNVAKSIGGYQTQSLPTIQSAPIILTPANAGTILTPSQLLNVDYGHLLNNSFVDRMNRRMNRI